MLEKGITITTPLEIMQNHKPVGEVGAMDIESTVSWADDEKDISAWISNEMQWHSFESLQNLIKYAQQIDNASLMGLIRRISSADHFYYMSTKGGHISQIIRYFSPYNSPQEAFITYIRALSLLEDAVFREIWGKRN